jgi:hypothetical protein
LKLYLLYKKRAAAFPGWNFRCKLIENLISKCHIKEDRPLGRPPKTAPPTSMNAPHYPSYIAAAVSKENPRQCCVKCYKKDQRRETRYKCENCGLTLCTAPCFQRYHMEATYRSMTRDQS